MDAQVQEYMEKFPEDVREMFAALRQRRAIVRR